MLCQAPEIPHDIIKEPTFNYSIPSNPKHWKCPPFLIQRTDIKHTHTHTTHNHCLVHTNTTHSTTHTHNSHSNKPGQTPSPILSHPCPTTFSTCCSSSSSSSSPFSHHFCSSESAPSSPELHNTHSTHQNNTHQNTHTHLVTPNTNRKRKRSSGTQSTLTKQSQQVCDTHNDPNSPTISLYMCVCLFRTNHYHQQ